MSSELSQIIVNTVYQGSLYALVGIGFVVLYRATGVINFAQGGLMVMGAYVFYGFATAAGLGFWPSLICAAALLGIVGALVYSTVFRRMTGATSFIAVMATFGLNIVLVAITTLIWGAGALNLPDLLSTSKSVTIIGLDLSTLVIVTVVLMVVVVLGLEIALRYTRVGMQMRAVANSVLLASLLKIKTHRLLALAWATAAACATIAGVLASLQSSLSIGGLQSLGLLAFAPILLGGLDSVLGVLVAGMAVALVQSIVAYTAGGQWTEVVAYATILLVLVWRPQGIFGSVEVARL